MSVQALSKSRPLIVGVIGNQTRNKYTAIVSTPPRNRISFAEKVTHGIIMTAAILAFPLYVSTNLKHYKGSN
ncbi:uncharacterized protein LOC117171218 [Belonocnema kinseyi]|uniref:uncharacterized protein LOC117171218 n=1 Tax=Belonocnema kinseyi TaxID=2817044 RepID=UPI00143D22D0|nr:uncharacterized protein LOC117171218 [Belonocnema kinseyi]